MLHGHFGEVFMPYRDWVWMQKLTRQQRMCAYIAAAVFAAVVLGSYLLYAVGIVPNSGQGFTVRIWAPLVVGAVAALLIYSVLELAFSFLQTWFPKFLSD